MKSLTDLNAKWWYRLAKVLYCGIFLIFGIMSASAIFLLNKSDSAPDWKIACMYGNQTTFNALHGKGIAINDFNPDKAVPESMNAQILTACGITQADIDSAKAVATAKTLQARMRNNCTSADIAGTGIRGLLCGGYYSSATYTIGQTLVPVSTLGKAIGYAILDILVFLFLFEVIRRAFYYIALGKVRPPK